MILSRFTAAVSLDTFENRDVKGMYKNARRCNIRDCSGISSPCEEPQQAEIIVNTDQHSIDECVDQNMATLESIGTFRIFPQKDKYGTEQLCIKQIKLAFIIPAVHQLAA